MTESSAAPRPVAAQYCATFLKPEMLHVYRQVTGLQRFRAVVFTQKRENAEQFPFEPIVSLPKPATHQLRRFWQKSLLGRPIQIYRSEARRIDAELRRVEAAVLHIYFGHIGVHLLPLIERTKIPVIVSFHGADGLVDMDKRPHREATGRMLEKASLVLARSESLAARIEALGCPREKIRIHRTGIPLGNLRFRERSAPPDGAWKFLQACRLIPKKGLTTSLRAFAAFAQDYPAATLTIAGEGSMEAELKTLAADLGIAARVQFDGFLSEVTLRALYYEAHVFLHPSQLGADGNQEGVPNSMLEAMATGLPVLATQHGGIPEAVDDGVSGFLVPERDDVVLAEAMRKLAANPGTYTRMSREAAAAVAAKFELSEQIRVLENCYEEAIRLHPERRRGAA